MSEIQPLVVIQLGENVRSVRYKIEMEATDYLSLWRTINVTSNHDLSSIALVLLTSEEQSAGYLSKDLRNHFS